jgi:hypothetical protein
VEGEEVRGKKEEEEGKREAGGSQEPTCKTGPWGTRGEEKDKRDPGGTQEHRQECLCHIERT